MTNRWVMFAGDKHQPHMRLHYLHKDGATSAGFVEQRDIKNPRRNTMIAENREFYATCNERREALNDTKVSSLEEGMTLIEWLTHEKEKEA